MPYSGSFFLTTVYPTDATGAHGNSGDEMAGKDVFPSGKGRKRPEISGNRYSKILWVGKQGKSEAGTFYSFKYLFPPVG